VASLPDSGEAQVTSSVALLSEWSGVGVGPTVSPDAETKSGTGTTGGGWRRNGQKIRHMK
jgi:hypothetical protein